MLLDATVPQVLSAVAAVGVFLQEVRLAARLKYWHTRGINLKIWFLIYST